jgi:hypothetical protein
MSYRRGRFSVISAITSASIDLGYLSDRVDDIPSVEWLVSRVATAMEWPEDFVVLSAAAGGAEYRCSSGTSAGGGTPLVELSRHGQHIELRVTLLDVEGDNWLCHLCGPLHVGGHEKWLGHVTGPKHSRALRRQQRDEMATARLAELMDE